MVKGKNKKVTLVEIKNSARGAISLLKAKGSPDYNKIQWKRVQRARTQINQSKVLAKKVLSHAEYENFYHWLKIQLQPNTSAGTLGKDLTLLGIMPNSISSASLKLEIELACKRINEERESILDFFSSAQALNIMIEQLEFTNALESLKEIIEKQSYSYWGIETEIALLQSALGIEAMKSRVAELKGLAFGLNRFIFHHLGQRNEPAQNIVRYLSSTKKRVEDSDLEDEIKVYSIYRLTSSISSSEKEMATTLACEQLNNQIDLTFTLIKVLTEIYTNSNKYSEETINAAETATIYLRQFFELLDLAYIPMRDKQTTELEHDVENQVSSITKIKQAVERSISLLTENSDFDQDATKDELVLGITDKLSTSSTGFHSEVLQKKITNFSYTTMALAINGFAKTPPLPKILLEYLRSPEVSKSTALTFKSIVLQKLNSYLYESSNKSNFSNKLVHALNTIGCPDNFDEKVLEDLKPDQENQLLSDCVTVLAAHRFFDDDNLKSCITTCANGAISNENISDILPIIEVLSGKKWKEIKLLANGVDLPICLDLYLKLSNERSIKTYKRYSVEQVISMYNIKNLSTLAESLFGLGIEKRKIEFFIYNSCDISTIELLPGVSTSKQAKEIRAAILKDLYNILDENPIRYEVEALQIEENLALGDGLEFLDDSKVYADEQAILNKANKLLLADFQRYISLVESGIGSSDSFEDIIKSIKNPSAKLFHIPKNDADDLLGEIVTGIMEIFLHDPAAGLDIIIGRRIRHGTISSEIRGVLESRGLIGQRPTVGSSYTPPRRVVELTENLEGSKRRSIYTAFNRFSNSIDALIATMRDEYFHIKSIKKPRGIFDLQITPGIMVVIRTLASKCYTIEDLTKEVIDIFWVILSSRSEKSRVTVSSELKRDFNTIFTRLIGDTRSIPSINPKLISDIKSAGEELQRKSEIISGWIRVPTFSVEGKSYAMEYIVDVATAKITSQHQNFRPCITKNIVRCPELDTHGFSITEDALYIALDNIFQHSGIRLDNKVDINIEFDQFNLKINFEIISSLSPKSRTEEKEARILGTLKEIKRSNYSARAKLDRGSGLCKLAAIVMQSPETNIDFGYLGEDKFRLYFEMKYINKSSPLETEQNQ
ncbi:MAG: hypothetical protein Q8S94_11385 [Pseudohongiella sp.]|nr:hypothetical protein [Pseudohongiella sp.]